MLSDEELAKIAWMALAVDELGGEDVAERVWAVSPGGVLQRNWLDVARAVRAALCPPVTPLAPGDFEDISDRLRVVSDAEDGEFGLMIWAEGEEGPGNYDQLAYLDAAGVAQLELACARWRAAQEGDDDDH